MDNKKDSSADLVAVKSFCDGGGKRNVITWLESLKTRLDELPESKIQPLNFKIGFGIVCNFIKKTH